jgi:acetolactate synthase-1/2/3 large subunit
MMAAGYARASGRIAACFVVPGPGLTNALTGLGMAYSESVPLLLVAAQNRLADLAREQEDFHELRDSLAVAGSVCGFTRRVHRPEDLSRAVRDAMRALTCEHPRPAYLEVPLDVLAAEGDLEPLSPETIRRPAGSRASILEAAELLDAAKRPLLFVGGGAVSAGAGGELRRLAERLAAPVITSAYAKGILPEDHPLALGDGWGRLDQLYAEVLHAADLALVIGARFDYTTDASNGAAFPRQIIQIDLDPAAIGKRRPVRLGIVGDAAMVLAELAASPVLGPPLERCWLDVAAVRRRKQEWLAQRAGPVLELLSDLRAALPRNTIVVDDLTLVGYWAPVLWETYEPRTLLHPGTYGTLGYALPAAIGASIACPDRPVVAIAGDGGLLYTIQELATLQAERPNLLVLVFNDQAYGALRTVQDRAFGGRRVASDLVNPDFVKLAEAFDLPAHRASPDSLATTVRQALATGGPHVIEIPFAPPPPASVPPWMT